MFNKFQRHYDVHFLPDWFQLCTSHNLQAKDDHFAVKNTYEPINYLTSLQVSRHLTDTRFKMTYKSVSGLILTGQQASSGQSHLEHRPILSHPGLTRSVIREGYFSSTQSLQRACVCICVCAGMYVCVCMYVCVLLAEVRT